MRMTQHFTLEDLADSPEAARLGILNHPPAALYPNLLRLSEGLERVRAMVGEPIIILSGYRCPALNKAIGGSKHSAHMDGLAADIRASGVQAKTLAKTLTCNPAGIGFDQLILEHPDSPAGGWVHIAFDLAPRHEVLTATGRPVIYRKGLPK